LVGDEHYVVGLLQEVEAEGRLDSIAVDALGPSPVEVGHGLEAAEAAATEAALEAATGAVLELDAGDVFQDLLGAPAAPGSQGNEVVESLGGVAQAEEAELVSQIGGHSFSLFGWQRAS